MFRNFVSKEQAVGWRNRLIRTGGSNPTTESQVARLREIQNEINRTSDPDPSLDLDPDDRLTFTEDPQIQPENLAPPDHLLDILSERGEISASELSSFTPESVMSPSLLSYTRLMAGQTDFPGAAGAATDAAEGMVTAGGAGDLAFLAFF